MDTYAKSHPDRYRATLADLLDALAAGRIHPVVAGRIPLTDAARAHTLIERGGHTGKFVLTTPAYRHEDGRGARRTGSGSPAGHPS